MATAEAVARSQHRSTAEQIEHWAEIGRLIEPQLAADDLRALAMHTVEVEVKKRPPPTADHVWNQLSARHSDDAPVDRLLGLGTRYQISIENPGWLERLDDNDAMTIGQFRDGQFVPK